MSRTTLASLTGVQKRFGKVAALDGFDLAVHRGELLALLGPNGAGKSTAISMLLGLQTADQGEVRLFDHPPQEIDGRRRIGVMMQEVMLPGVMRCRELLEQVAGYYPMPYDVPAVIKRLGLEGIAERRYDKLSGGQKRQLQFGLALIGRPELMFLDEPTVGMDVQAREALWRVIRDLLHEGCSIVLTTHYLEEAEALADRVVVMARGKVVTTGTVDEIRANVSRKQVSLVSKLAPALVRAWPEVLSLAVERDRLQITTRAAEPLLQRLFREDPDLTDIEVRRAGLAEAFTELTTDNQEAQP
ncbi:MAG TPA: ABC transporter ATP-binding protein [Steroidobacteraceae bacterium]|nr:ABC transporter ATP-binding protein [Steroidobacteraceae bacterium]